MLNITLQIKSLNYNLLVYRNFCDQNRISLKIDFQVFGIMHGSLLLGSNNPSLIPSSQDKRLDTITWTILGYCLPETNWPSKSMTMRILSLIQPCLRPSWVHSSSFILAGPSDLTGKHMRSLSSPTLRHLVGSLSFWRLDHHHQTKNTAVPAPTTAALTKDSLVRSVEFQ